MSMQLRSDVRFNSISNNLVCLINIINTYNVGVVDNIKIMVEVFKMINEHIVFMMNCMYNKKKGQTFALAVILKCDKLCAQCNTLIHNYDELMELMAMIKKKTVSHLKKILKKKETYLTSSNLEQIALLKL